MDNATFHKRADIQELLIKHGHQILWLPTYSPDLNPIEKMWAWVKKKRKEWLVDSIDVLFKQDTTRIQDIKFDLFKKKD